MKNAHLTSLDTNQVMIREHDESSDAKRVIIVGGEDTFAQAIKDSLSNLTLDVKMNNEQQAPIIIEKPVIHEVIKEVAVIQKEIQIEYVEKPYIITETKIIEVPRIQEVVRIEYIEKPILIEKKEIVEISNSKDMKILLILNIVSILILAISRFI